MSLIFWCEEEGRVRAEESATEINGRLVSCDDKRARPWWVSLAR